MYRKIIVLLCLLGICSCKTKYIETPVVKTEYVILQLKDTIFRYDSIYRFDSTVIHTVLDTVYVDRYHNIYRYKNKYVTSYKNDTILKVDSIPYKVEVTKYTNRLNLIQRILIYVGICFIVLLVLYVIIKAIKK